MNMKTYTIPVVNIYAVKSRGILCNSLGGETGYSGSDIIGGGTLTDDDD